MDMEKEFEMMQKELNELKVEKENLEQKVIELNRLNESIKNLCCLFFITNTTTRHDVNFDLYIECQVRDLQGTARVSYIQNKN